jgi:hypothetical protein
MEIDDDKAQWEENLDTISKVQGSSTDGFVDVNLKETC